MNAHEAIESLSRIVQNAGSQINNMDLCVRVFQPGAVGGSPCVKVLGLTAGFDWDSNRVFVDVEPELSVLSQAERDAIVESVRLGQSLQAYEAQKALKMRILALEAEVALLKKDMDGRNEPTGETLAAEVDALRIAAGIELEDSFESGSTWAVGNAELASLVALSKKSVGAPLPEHPTDTQLADACMWLRHDFGLLDEAQRFEMMVSLQATWMAIWKACNTPGYGGQFVPERQS